MTIDTEEIMKLLQTLAKEEKLKVTVKRCIQGGLIVGGATTIGGLLLGPFGLAIGGIAASLFTAFGSQNKFQSVFEIISTMEADKKEALADNVRNILRNLDINDAVALAAILSGNASVRRQVTLELLGFINSEIGMAVTTH